MLPLLPLIAASAAGGLVINSKLPKKTPQPAPKLPLTESCPPPSTQTSADTPKTPGPVATAVGNVATEVVCKAAVIAAVSQGLPPGLASAADAICVAALPRLVKLGYTGAKLTAELTKVAMSKLFTKRPKEGMQTIKGKGKNVKHLSGGSSVPHMAGGGQLIQAPVSQSRVIRRKNAPRTKQLANGAIRVAHTEMLGTMVTGTPVSNISPYTVSGYRINPGVSSLFPWLSTIAVNYDKYVFRKIRVGLIPLVSTAFNGRIGVGFDPDSTDDKPADRVEFFSLAMHSENAPWLECAIDVPCDNIKRFTGTHTAADSKLIDLGQILTFSDQISSISAAVGVADIVVSYDVELHMPQQALFSTQGFAKTNSYVAGAYDLTNVVANVTVEGISVGVVRKVNSTTVEVDLPQGAYIIDFYAEWSVGSVTFTTTGTGFTIKGKNISAAGVMVSHALVRAANAFTVIYTVSGVTWESNLTRHDVSITRISPTVYNNFAN